MSGTGGGDGDPSAWRPRPLVVCGPSGSGKSTLIKKLMAEFGDKIGFSVSHTTRKPRPGEKDGIQYHFVTAEEMSEGIRNGDFIESAFFAGNTYGTSKAAVSAVFAAGKICLLEIEVQGVKQVKAAAATGAFDPPPVYVFIRPPSLETLEERLRSRGTEAEESVQRRLDTAKVELEYGSEPGNFDLIIVNEDLDAAYEELKSFVAALFK